MSTSDLRNAQHFLSIDCLCVIAKISSGHHTCLVGGEGVSLGAVVMDSYKHVMLVFG